MKRLTLILVFGVTAVMILSACGGGAAQDAASTVESVVEDAGVDVDAAQATAETVVESVSEDVDAAQATAETVAESVSEDADAAQPTEESMEDDATDTLDDEDNCSKGYEGETPLHPSTCWS